MYGPLPQFIIPSGVAQHIVRQGAMYFGALASALARHTPHVAVGMFMARSRIQRRQGIHRQFLCSFTVPPESCVILFIGKPNGEIRSPNSKMHRQTAWRCECSEQAGSHACEPVFFMAMNMVRYCDLRRALGLATVARHLCIRSACIVRPSSLQKRAVLFSPAVD